MSCNIMHQCKCDDCQNNIDSQQVQLHHQMNVMMSRLNEQQRRWYAAIEAHRHGHGGIALVQRITGLDAKTIRNGMRELDNDLEERPDDRVRLPGAGRPSVEKKARSSRCR